MVYKYWRVLLVNKVFDGVATAIVTPFNYKGCVDYVALNKLLSLQLGSNIDAIVVLGTTGESSTISFQEREQIIKYSKEIIGNKAKLIVGVGSNNTVEALKYLRQAQALGADACLAVTPYYNKCTQKGAFIYYKTLSDEATIPIIIYNVPSRTGFNLNTSTIEKISSLNNIVGIKEANQDINHILDLFDKLKGKTAIYCGNDNLNYIFKCLGGSGVISVSSNAYPQLVKRLWTDKNIKQDCLYEFNKLIFVEPNPIPIKYVLYKLGYIKNILRPPLTSISNLNIKPINLQLQKLKELV